jgi:hypothetical protein
VVNGLQHLRLIDIGQLKWVSMNWKLWFLRFLVRIEIYSESLSYGKESYLTTAFKPWVNGHQYLRLIDIGQLYWISMNWKLWFLRFLVRLEIYSESLSYGKESYLTTAFKPWLISMRC